MRAASSFKAVDYVMDSTIMRYLFEHKVATATQVRRDIMPDYRLASVRNRLLKLRNRKMIESQSLYDLGRISIYSLTRRGFKGFISKEWNKSKFKLKSEYPQHDLKLVDLKFDLLRSENVTRYFTENLSKSEGPVALGKEDCTSFVNPDALLELKLDDSSGFIAALELEQHLKYKAMYLSLFERYYSSFDISAVLFVSSKDSILRSVQIYEREYCKGKDSKFFYSNFKHWDVDRGRVFRDVHGEGFVLN